MIDVKSKVRLVTGIVNKEGKLPDGGNVSAVKVRLSVLAFMTNFNELLGLFSYSKLQSTTEILKARNASKVKRTCLRAPSCLLNFR